jgi:hypothetical protein
VLTSLLALLRLAVLSRLGVFICALGVLLSAASTASALEPAQTKTRVWGFDLAEHNCAGLFRATSSGKHQGNRLAEAEEASGSLLAARAAGAAERLVIGRGADLAKPGAVQAGERILQWPSKLPNVAAEWKANSGFLRQEMGRGLPIRDASPGNTGGMFLNAERNLLESRGWTFDSATNFWMPPGG